MRNLTLLVCLFILFGCSDSNSEKVGKRKMETTDQVKRVLPAMEAIKARNNTLVALTANTSGSYFVYKGQTLGYEYELLQNLADYLDVKLDIKLVEDMDSLLIKLNEGEGDLVAYSLTVTNPRRQEVNFTQRLFDSPQVLVQKKPDDWRKMKLHEIDQALIRNVLEIQDAPVYVRRNSSYYDRLMNLGDEIGDSINIITVSGDVTTFDLIDRVARGEIEYTIADEEIVKVYTTYNDMVDYKTSISMPQKKAWAVRKNSPLLLDTLNVWLTNFKKYKEYYYIYDKYFENPRVTRRIARSDYTSIKGKLSQYDDMIKREADSLGWDWRLLASQIYQESRFDPNEKSWMGAVGLMQVLPSTGKMHGFYHLTHPESNIRAGVAHLKYIEKNFTHLDSINQIKFTLASYNVGMGHVFDAMRLASYLGKDSTVWDDNVAEALLKKRYEKYFKLPICKNGYCRGQEPYNYVNEILDRYEDYKRLIH